MTISEKVDKFILEEGEGSERDALIKAIIKVELYRKVLDVREAHIHGLVLEIDQLKADLEMVGSSF